jgi:hypothetical protein
MWAYNTMTQEQADAITNELLAEGWVYTTSGGLVSPDSKEAKGMNEMDEWTPSYDDCFTDPWADDYAAIIRGEI